MRTGRFVDTDRILPAIYGRDSHCVFKTLPRLPLNSIRGEADLGRLFENDIMISFFVIRGTRRGIPFALGAALSLLGNVSALAQQSSDKTLPPVVVSSTRFENNVEPGPIGATIITAEQIREAGVNNVNEAIRKIAGVYGRQNLNGTQDSALDLRGFGDDSRQNLVVLVDGIRLSENELANPLLSSVPIELVERIEIIRGGSSVLYGEGATAGVINVITKRAKPNAQGGSLVGEAGSYAHRELRASAAKSWESLALDANIGELRTDNYRANNALRQRNFSGGVQWGGAQGRIGLRVDALRQDSRLPGSLTMAQFNADPRQAATPNDFGSNDTDRYTLFADRKLGAYEFAAELSQRYKTAKGHYVSSSVYDSKADSQVTQFSPRLRHVSMLGGWANDLVGGIDLARWSRTTVSDYAGAPSSRANAFQSSRALYVRDEIKGRQMRIALGARHENFDKDSVDPVSPAKGTYARSFGLNAWELQGSYAVIPAVELFAKTGQSYRVANVDENAGILTPARPLEPQTSHDLEGGVTVGNASTKATVRYFQHSLKNEIFYNPLVFANVNLDPTRRRGVEIEASSRLASTLSLTANAQHVSAEFTDGANAGKEMVLVPRNIATVRLTWLPTARQTADLGVQWVDTQRYGGDFSNACSSRIPSYTTLDARYAIRMGAWEIAAIGTNLTGRDYFSNAFGACGSGIYPDPGRQLRLSARLDF